jgi:cellulose biosynthesis protein BcsQ
MSETAALAFVGATGGAGTTRLTLEAATLLARDGRDVVVLDAAYATQGMARWVSGRLDPDLTALVTDETDESLEAGLVDLDLDVVGRVRCCPARAPFERIARAKTRRAAERLEGRIEEARTLADVVCLDVPPVAANQSVAAVDAADAVGIVTPADERGADAVGRMEGILADVGCEADGVVATRGELHVADAAVPAVGADATPTAATDDGAFAAGVAEACSTLVGEDVATGESGRFGTLGDLVSR